MVTFLVSGLWHGANWTFVLWGGIHGIFQTLGGITSGARIGVKKKFGLYNNKVINFISILITFALVCFGWIFFRANTASDALYVIKNMLFGFRGWSDKQYIYEVITGMGLNLYEMFVVAAALLFMVITEFFSGKRPVYDVIENKNSVIRLIFYTITAVFILSAGVFYEAGAFIYFQF